MLSGHSINPINRIIFNWWLNDEVADLILIMILMKMIVLALIKWWWVACEKGWLKIHSSSVYRCAPMTRASLINFISWPVTHTGLLGYLARMSHHHHWPHDQFIEKELVWVTVTLDVLIKINVVMISLFVIKTDLVKGSLSLSYLELDDTLESLVGVMSKIICHSVARRLVMD